MNSITAKQDFWNIAMQDLAQLQAGRVPARCYGWANAHAVRDQHDQEVTQLESEAFVAAARQVRS